MDKMREGFEQAFRERFPDAPLDRHPTDENQYDGVAAAWTWWAWQAARTQPACPTCNGHGMVGGPSYREPDEGGQPCPDCAPHINYFAAMDVAKKYGLEYEKFCAALSDMAVANSEYTARLQQKGGDA